MKLYSQEQVEDLLTGSGFQTSGSDIKAHRLRFGCGVSIKIGYCPLRSRVNSSAQGLTLIAEK